jgi:hypothetical protein
LTLTGKRKNIANQWKLESAGKGYYKILNRENSEMVFECSLSHQDLNISHFTGNDNQFWKIENAYNGLFRISNKQFPNIILSVNTPLAEGIKAGLLDSENGSFFGWNLLEVCEMKQEAFKPHIIPGTIEAEDFDLGCPGDAYYDSDNINQGGQYRTDTGVDIEKCDSGGYNVGWINSGEWLAYTVHVNKGGNYVVEFYVAAVADGEKLHIEFDDKNISGSIPVINTGGYQIWKRITTKVRLAEGNHLMKIVFDEAGLRMNFDKVIFTAE